MSFKESIIKVWSVVYVRHIVLAMTIVGVLIASVMIALGFYTRHGARVVVPEVKDVSIETALSALESYGLRGMVVDSVYMRDKAPGIVVEQVPSNGQSVKPNRIVFLTVNSMSKRMVVLPNLIDISIRQAQSLVTSMGLKVGYIKTSPSDFKDLVIEATFNGSPVRQGSRVPDGGIISFLIGDGVGDTLEIDTLNVEVEELELN